MNLRQITVRTVVHTPEETGLDHRIPVALADTLNEDTQTDTVPVRTQIDTILITRRRIADNVQITMVVERRTLTSVFDLSVTVEIEEFQVTGISTEIVAIFMERIYGPVICLLIGQEITVGAEAPDIAQFLAFIVRVDRTIGVVVILHPSAAVPDADLHIVIERFPADLKAVAPRKRCLPAFGLQCTEIALGRSLTKHLRIIGTIDQHIVGITPIVIE